MGPLSQCRFSQTIKTSPSSAHPNLLTDNKPAGFLTLQTSILNSFTFLGDNLPHRMPSCVDLTIFPHHLLTMKVSLCYPLPSLSMLSMWHSHPKSPPPPPMTPLSSRRVNLWMAPFPQHSSHTSQTGNTVTAFSDIRVASMFLPSIPYVMTSFANVTTILLPVTLGSSKSANWSLQNFGGQASPHSFVTILQDVLPVNKIRPTLTPPRHSLYPYPHLPYLPSTKSPAI